MSNKCWLLRAVPFSGSPYTWKACGENSSLEPRTIGGQTGVYWVIDGVDMFGGSYVQATSTIEIVADEYPATYGSCASCTPVTPSYDCINGACVASSTYSTPGIFSSLEDCQAQCSANGNCGDGKVCADINYCPPGKVCIEQGEYSEVQGLMNRLSSELS